MRKAVRIAVSVILAFIVGIIVVSLLFSDLGPGETMSGRMLTVVAILFLAGGLLGYFDPDVWPIAGVAAWGVLLFSVAGLFTMPAESAIILLWAVAPAFLGGYIGFLLARYTRSRSHRKGDGKEK